MPERPQTQITKSYYSDLEKDGMIFAKTVRSTKKSGILKGVEIKDLPEGYFLIDAKNFPGRNSIETLGVTAEILCSEKILYEGQPIAILAGPDKKVLEELAAKAKVEIEAMPGPAEKTILSQKKIILGGGRQKNVRGKKSSARHSYRASCRRCGGAPDRHPPLEGGRGVLRHGQPLHYGIRKDHGLRPPFRRGHLSGEHHDGV